MRLARRQMAGEQREADDKKKKRRKLERRFVRFVRVGGAPLPGGFREKKR